MTAVRHSGGWARRTRLRTVGVRWLLEPRGQHPTPRDGASPGAEPPVWNHLTAKDMEEQKALPTPPWNQSVGHRAPGGADRQVPLQDLASRTPGHRPRLLTRHRLLLQRTSEAAPCLRLEELGSKLRPVISQDLS